MINLQITVKKLLEVIFEHECFLGMRVLSNLSHYTLFSQHPFYCFYCPHFLGVT